ncbi:MAG: histidine kinase [Bacteroidota bacterium]
MKSLTLNNKKVEILFYVLIWVLVFSVPYFSERSSGHINWNELARNWTHILGYLVVFLINVYVLVPCLLMKRRYLYYFVSVSALILLIIALPLLLQPGIQTHAGSPNDGLRTTGINTPMQKPPLLVFADNLILCILILGAGTSTRLMSKWLSEQKLRKDAEKEHLKTNLALLRHQVSPHFFMNTLNNIHSLIEMDTAKAQDAVERLSTLMRYLLYDSARNTIELKKEIEFIHSFISLMQLRHSDEVDVKTIIPKQIPDAQIPPMLFISLIENAFKHGVCYPLKSYIYFELQILETSLLCIVKNSKHKNTTNQHGEYSGIGLDNIKDSLRLLYEDNFRLNILDTENEFEVTLSIPV